MRCALYFYPKYTAKYRHNRNAAIVDKYYFANIVARVYCSKGRCCAPCIWRRVDKHRVTYTTDSGGRLKNLKNTTFRWPIDSITQYIIHDVCVCVCKKNDPVMFTFSYSLVSIRIYLTRGGEGEHTHITFIELHGFFEKADRRLNGMWQYEKLTFPYDFNNETNGIVSCKLHVQLNCTDYDNDKKTISNQNDFDRLSKKKMIWKCFYQFFEKNEFLFC